MNRRTLMLALTVAAGLITVAARERACATGVPIGGFLPMVGIALTDEFDDDLNTFAVSSPAPGPQSMMLGSNGTAFYDVALLDTGAAVSVLTAQADLDFNIDGPYPGEPDGFRGTEQIQIGGATGLLFADINDPVGLYAGGLQGAGTNPLVLSDSVLEGQTNTSLITIPAESDLPNVVGLPFASQYATVIRSDQPQVFQLNGQTVRTPQIEFLPLGTGGSQGIARRAPMSLNPGDSFTLPPSWLYNIENFDIDNPHENPFYPTLLQGGLFLNVNAENEGEVLGNTQFVFDTGVEVTVMSQLNALFLGFDVGSDEPEFTIAVVGSGGINLEVPGFFADEFTIAAIGGSITLTQVPIVVLNVPDPADPSNYVEGIVGTNVLAGRNVVIDPEPALAGGSGPNLYISDPVTTQKNWTTTAASGTFGTGGNWNGGTAPTTLGIANVRHVSGGNQTAVVTSNTQVWEVNVSGAGGNTMTVDVAAGVTLTTFSGVNIEPGGVVTLSGSTLDAQYVEILGGRLQGAGIIETGSGILPGQVENRIGTVAPGNGVGSMTIQGRFANGIDGILAIELGGEDAGTEYDQLIVDGQVTLEGTLQVSLVDLGSGLFMPGIGATFEILSAADGLSGSFDTLLLPGSYDWDVTYGLNAVVLEVLGTNLIGDYNDDGVVNGADYTVWRDALGEEVDEPGDGADGDFSGLVDEGDFTEWRNHFGMTSNLGGGSLDGGQAAVPEPTSLVLLLAAGFAVAVRNTLAGQWHPRELLSPAPVRCATSTSCGALSCG